MIRVQRTTDPVSAHDHVRRRPAPSEARSDQVLSSAVLLGLQRSIGNTAVARMVAEQQDRNAVQRQLSVHDVMRSSGQPLAQPTQQDMEAKYGGVDFSDVRTHTDAVAQRSAAELGARAYTVGEHVVFGAGGMDTDVLAHELSHVLQQRGGPVLGSDHGDGVRVSDPSDRFEREAEDNARRVKSGSAPSIRGNAGYGAATGGQAAVQRYVVVRPGDTSYPTKGSQDEEGQAREPGEDFFPSQVAVGGSYVDASGGANIRYQGTVPLRISSKGDLAVEDTNVAAKAFFATDKRIEQANNNLKGIVDFRRARSGNYLTLRRTKRFLKIKAGSEEVTLWQVEPEVTRQPAVYSLDTEPTVQRGDEVRLSQRCNEIAYEVTHRYSLDSTGEMRYFDAVADILGELTKTSAKTHKKEMEQARHAAAGMGRNEETIKAYTDKLAAMLQEAMKLRTSRAADFTAAVAKFKLNEFTPPPAVGDVFMIKALQGDSSSGALDFHFGAVVARSGSDYITMENFARHGDVETLSGGDPQWYFQMYGTEDPAQTWHRQWGWEARFPGRFVLSILIGG
jgi:hypothetical protein